MKLFIFLNIFTAISAQRLQPPAPPAKLITAAAPKALVGVVSSIDVNDGSHPSPASMEEATGTYPPTNDKPAVQVRMLGPSLQATNHDSSVALTSGSYNRSYIPADHQYGPNDGQSSGHDYDGSTWNPDWSGPQPWTPPTNPSAYANDLAKPDDNRTRKSYRSGRSRKSSRSSANDLGW
eukprot:scaffold53080_cov36-Cyclotella_meneghiniana.AAC.2